MERLHPAYFALVMATGIVAIACHLLGLERIAQGLLPVNVAAYVTLAVLNLARAVRYPARFVADLTDHQRGVGFFTAVAATGVLGSQCRRGARGPHRRRVPPARSPSCSGPRLTYTVFTALTVKETKPSLAEGINGGWLVAVVATQSIASLAGLLLSRLEAQREPLALRRAELLAVRRDALHLDDLADLLSLHVLHLARPRTCMPPYWINMGAMAISTLAGTTLVANAAGSPLLLSMDPFLRGFTVLFWATATWWIPMLVILGAWRHVYRRVPARATTRSTGAPSSPWGCTPSRPSAWPPSSTSRSCWSCHGSSSSWRSPPGRLTFAGLVRSLATAVEGPAHASL